MSKLESKKEIINNTQENLFNFLTDFNNFERIMPAEKISKWASTNEECSFTINGMASIGMKIDATTPNALIKIVSHGKNPFSFDLYITIEAVEADKSAVQMILEASLNPFLKVVVEKPLTNFFNILVENLQKINE